VHRSPLYTRGNAYSLIVVCSCVLIAGLFADNSFAYFCIALPVIVQIMIWFRVGAHGIPIIPLLFAVFFIYYGVPLLRAGTMVYSPSELVEAGIAVGSFLVAAGLASWPFLFAMRRRDVLEGDSEIGDNQVVAAIYVGLASGIAYHLVVLSGNGDWFGSWLGLVRSMMMTLAGVGCYLLGYARAKRILAGEGWLLASCCFAILILCSVANLFLNGGMVLVLGAILGYCLTKGRVPWLGLTLAAALFAVLHAGKVEERDKYWGPGTSPPETLSIAQIPGMMLDWLATGVVALVSGSAETDLLERASLLQMLVLIQRSTPDFIPYLAGETYARLPEILVPRFIDPEKPISQSGLNQLSIHYGLQTEDATGSTTIAWGLIAEAYANFGFWAILAVGALLGALCGALMWFSAGASATSWRVIMGISATLALSDVEADFAFLIVTLMQTIISALGLAALLRLMAALLRSAAVASQGRSRMVQTPAAQQSPPL
jgi:hypothetical protein